MPVPFQLEGVAAIPLKVTVLVPCAVPKFVPVIVTGVPTAPEVTERLLIVGAGTTVNCNPLLGAPFAVTTTFPVVAPDGTGTTMLVGPQLEGVAAVPLNATLPFPADWVAPKFTPAIVTEEPTAPVDGSRLVNEGMGTVKLKPLLAPPPETFTTTFPVVAPLGTATVMLDIPHDVGLAVTPLNVTVLEPWERPKLLPEIVTVVPGIPAEGAMAEITGVGAEPTVKGNALLTSPPKVVTITGPDVAPVGTATEIAVEVQLVAPANCVPLKVICPGVSPRLSPLIVTEAPTLAKYGAIDAMVGVTVNAAPLLYTPLALTKTFPVAALTGTVTTI
jgi:hypothetical protein